MSTCPASERLGSGEGTQCRPEERSRFLSYAKGAVPCGEGGDLWVFLSPPCRNMCCIRSSSFWLDPEIVQLGSENRSEGT